MKDVQFQIYTRAVPEGDDTGAHCKNHVDFSIIESFSNASEIFLGDGPRSNVARASSINDICDRVIHWKRNLMRLPRCAESTRFITVLAKIYKYSVSVQESLSKAMVIGHLILQRDIRTSNKSLKEKLVRRMNAWCNQDYDTLFTEVHALKQLC
ncbi:hypothetical protein GJ496_006293 [Pomphorhynchus laevis]|nr:hypothetical protein GJ496_006293 [Pomphorhynchus laevis]